MVINGTWQVETGTTDELRIRLCPGTHEAPCGPDESLVEWVGGSPVTLVVDNRTVPGDAARFTIEPATSPYVIAEIRADFDFTYFYGRWPFDDGSDSAEDT